jgi:hypothetical protein
VRSFAPGKPEFFAEQKMRPKIFHSPEGDTAVRSHHAASASPPRQVVAEQKMRPKNFHSPEGGYRRSFTLRRIRFASTAGGCGAKNTPK